MANLTSQHKVWTNTVVLGEDLHDHHYISFPATIPIGKPGIYLMLIMDGYTGGSITPHGNFRFTVAFDNLKDLFQPKLLYISMWPISIQIPCRSASSNSQKQDIEGWIFTLTSFAILNLKFLDAELRL